MEWAEGGRLVGREGGGVWEEMLHGRNGGRRGDACKVMLAR